MINKLIDILSNLAYFWITIEILGIVLALVLIVYIFKKMT